VACPRARVCHVGQVYTPTRFVIDSDLCDTLGYDDGLKWLIIDDDYYSDDVDYF
jgi:hypothetical protein